MTERDSIIQHIEFYLGQIEDTRRLHMVLGFTRGVFKAQEEATQKAFTGKGGNTDG